MAINQLDRLFTVLARAIVLFTAMPVHEFAHGYVAYRLGDDTAKNQGRLSLNPIKHMDLLGSLLLIFTGFGWAKPVQVDPRYFKSPRKGMALTALAGPVSNVLLATVIMIIFKIFIRVAMVTGDGIVAQVIYLMLTTMITTNLYLAVFNLLPVPPLDGAKIFGAVLPDKYYFTIMRYERYIALALMAVLVFTDLLSGPIRFVAGAVFNVIDIATRPIELILALI